MSKKPQRGGYKPGRDNPNEGHVHLYRLVPLNISDEGPLTGTCEWCGGPCPINWAGCEECMP